MHPKHAVTLPPPLADIPRNFLVLLRGRKRYLLFPPSECAKLGILLDPSHPEDRHSAVDWADPEVLSRYAGLGAAMALDVTLEAGEALFIPSFWTHLIVSLTETFQLNAMTTVAMRHSEMLTQCAKEGGARALEIARQEAAARARQASAGGTAGSDKAVVGNEALTDEGEGEMDLHALELEEDPDQDQDESNAVAGGLYKHLPKLAPEQTALVYAMGVLFVAIAVVLVLAVATSMGVIDRGFFGGYSLNVRSARVSYSYKPERLMI